VSSVRVAVIYYSATGTNHAMAEEAVRAVVDLGAEARLRKVPELAPETAVAANPDWARHREATAEVPEATLEDVDWGDVLIFSTPTRYGGPAAQMKQFLDQSGPLWAKGRLTNKVVTAMTSAQNPHGGQEATLLALYTSMWHWGAIVVAPGYTDPAFMAAGGNPYGVSTVAAPGGNLAPEIRRAVRSQATRAVQVAQWLKLGQEVSREATMPR
jgi:NAD(P)H dehydrogenase (quinone)